MISSVSSSSVPLSTKIIQATGDEAKKNVVPSQTDPTIVATPENINKLTDKAEEGIQNKQQTEQAEQEAVRGLAVDVNHMQHQQALAEQYISQSTDSSESNSTLNIYDLAQQKNKADKLETIGNAAQAKDKFSDATTPDEPSYFHIQV
jgi:hypothetical protein